MSGLGPVPLPATVTGALLDGHAAHGPSAKFDGASAFTVPNATVPTTASPYTFMAFVRHTANSTDCICSAGQVTDTGNTAGMSVAVTTEYLRSDTDTGGSASTLVVPANVWSTVGIVTRAVADRTFFVDGVLQVGTASITSVACAGGFVVGARFRDGALLNTTQWQGDIGWVYVWNRALSDAALLQVYANPFCFLRPMTRRVVGWKAAAGGTAYDGTVSLSLAAALADLGALAWLGSASAEVQAALTESGLLALAGSSAFAASAATDMGGQEAFLGAGVLSALAAIAPASAGDLIGSGAFATAADLAASRDALTAWLGDAVFAVAAAMPVSGTLSLAGSTALAQIAALSASARHDLLLSAALGVLGSLQSSGQAGWPGTSAIDARTGLAASSTAAAQVTAALQILAALGAQSQAGLAGTMLLAAALGLASSNARTLAALLIDWLAEALTSASVAGDTLAAAGASRDTLTSSTFTDDTLR